MTIYHTHHIVPRYASGTDDPSNLIKLTVEEHAEAHLKLYEEHGQWQDYVAWKALSGQISYSDASYLAWKEGAYRGTLHLKGKTYEEAYGDRAEERRQQIVDSNKRRKGIKYKSMNRRWSTNDIKVSCIKCRHKTSLPQLNRHYNKH